MTRGPIGGPARTRARAAREPLALLCGASVLALAVARQSTLLSACLTGVFGAVLIALACRDARDRVVPNALVFPAIVAAVLAAPLRAEGGFSIAVAGGVAAGGLMGVTFAASRGGLGAGDVKMATLIGAIVGYPDALAALAVAALIGAVWSVGAFVTSGRHSIPYAPALAIGAAVILLRTG